MLTFQGYDPFPEVNCVKVLVLKACSGLALKVGHETGHRVLDVKVRLGSGCLVC